MPYHVEKEYREECLRLLREGFSSTEVSLLMQDARPSTIRNWARKAGIALEAKPGRKKGVHRPRPLPIREGRISAPRPHSKWIVMDMLRGGELTILEAAKLTGLPAEFIATECKLEGIDPDAIREDRLTRRVQAMLVQRHTAMEAASEAARARSPR